MEGLHEAVGALQPTEPWQPFVEDNRTTHQCVIKHHKLALEMFPTQLVTGCGTATTRSQVMQDKLDEEALILHCAASQGLINVVKAILAKGNAPCDLLDHYGRTALHWAAEQGHLLVTQALLHAGAFPERQTPRKVTPLMLAALNGHDEVVSVLLVAGAGKSDRCSIFREEAPWRSTALHCAAAKGHLAVVSRLLEVGFNKEQRDEAGFTPAEISARATYASSTRVTRCLLPQDIGARMVHDYVNMVMEDIDTVKGLAKCGAYLDWQDEIGNSPLHRAAHFGHVSITNILLQYGAEPDLRNHRGGSPLHVSACQGSVPITAALLEAGASIEGRMVNGRSPLHLAVINNNIDVVKLLLQEGAFTEHRERSRGQTPLSEAAEYGLAPIIRILLDAGANVESTSSAGLTPLHWACRFNHPKSVEVLLASGANPDAVDEAAVKAARMTRTQGGEGKESLQRTASDVVGLGDPCRWNVVMRRPFLGELVSIARQRLDPASTSQIMSALHDARRNHTWRRRGWLLVLACRRGAGGNIGLTSNISTARSHVSGCGSTSKSCDGVLKFSTKWNDSDTVCKTSRSFAKHSRCVDPSLVESAGRLSRRCVASHLGMRTSLRERQFGSNGGAARDVLNRGTVEALLALASVEFGVFRHVVGYI